MVCSVSRTSSREERRKIVVYADGGSRHNPGPAAIGIVVLDEDSHVLEQYKEYLGVATNNVAEYTALLKALELSARYTSGEVHVFMDSEIVVKQMNGSYQIKAPHLLPFYKSVRKCEEAFKKVIYRNVPRTNPYQLQADKLVNEALDEK